MLPSRLVLVEHENALIDVGLRAVREPKQL